MDNEDPYRIVLLIVAVVQNGAALYFLRKSGAVSTIFHRRAEAVFLSAAISVFFIAYCIGVIAYLIEPWWMEWSAFTIPSAIRWLGLAPLLLGSLLIIWGAQQIGANYTFSIITKEDHRLVTAGPYAWVRHPLYSGLLCGSIGVILLMANWFVAASAIGMWTLLAYRTRMEEYNLIERFGDEYRKYMVRVGMFLPRMKR